MLNRIAHLLKIKPPKIDQEGYLQASGDTVPTDGESGYAPSCTFQDTENGVLYVNEGTVDSCDFNAVTVA